MRLAATVRLAEPSTGLLRSIATLVLVVVATAASGESLHPQDGPHVDLRLELKRDAFVVEASMNLLFLDEVLVPEREQPDRIELSELRALRPALTARMNELCQVEIDGRRVEGRIEGLAKNDPDEALLPLFPRSGFRGLRKVRFELVYALAAPSDDSPRSIAIAWLLYPEDALSLEEPKPPLTLAAELIAQGMRSDIVFTQDEPEFVWHAEPEGGVSERLRAVPQPAASVGREVSLVGGAVTLAGGVLVIIALQRGRGAGRALVVVALGAVLAWWLPMGRIALDRRAPLPDDESARAVFRPLHANLYRAFDFVEESAIYDALALSVDGPLLEELFLTIRRSLIMQEEGGAMSRVRALRELEISIESIGLVSPGAGAEPLPGFVVRCRYQVDGRVTHWGHSHDRTNEYLARYTVIARPGGWRILDARVLEQARVDLPPGERDDGTFEL